jgi:hypothetical protein
MKPNICLVIILAVASMSCLVAGFVKGGNIDKCTEKYNLCVASCEKQKQQCKARGNSDNDCDAAYTTCALGCENRMHDCWKE